jgi:hypothetical protein
MEKILFLFIILIFNKLKTQESGLYILTQGFKSTINFQSISQDSLTGNFAALLGVIASVRYLDDFVLYNHFKSDEKIEEENEENYLLIFRRAKNFVKNSIKKLPCGEFVSNIFNVLLKNTFSFSIISSLIIIATFSRYENYNCKLPLKNLGILILIYSLDDILTKYFENSFSKNLNFVLRDIIKIIYRYLIYKFINKYFKIEIIYSYNLIEYFLNYKIESKILINIFYVFSLLIGNNIDYYALYEYIIKESSGSRSLKISLISRSK